MITYINHQNNDDQHVIISDYIYKLYLYSGIQSRVYNVC